MDRSQLEIELGRFCGECQEMGYPIIIEGLSEAYPGVSGTSYTLHIRVKDKWSYGLSCSELLDKVLPVLWESTSEKARKMIFSLDIYNVENGMNCHHLETFSPFDMVC